MDTSFASLELGGELHEHDIDTTFEDLPDEILARSLLGMQPPFSHRRICKQLRSLFDESCTQLRIQDQGRLQSDLPTAHGGPGLYMSSSKPSVFQHGDLLRLLKRLTRLDTLLDKDPSRGPALPWEEMGQILGGQLTRLVFHCNSQQLSFLELFPSLRRLEVYRSSRMTPQHAMELQPVSALRALLHLVLHGLPVKDLGPLTGCSQLQILELSFCPIEDLGPLVHCQKLCTVRLFFIDTLRDLGPLVAYVSLQHLDLYGCSSITDIKPLELCNNLLHLNLYTSRVTDFSALSSCTGLQRLCLFGCVHLHSLAPLASCRKLQYLDICMHTSTIPSLEPLWGLQELQHLCLLGRQSSGLHPGQPDLGPLATRVKYLRLNADYVGRFP